MSNDEPDADDQIVRLVSAGISAPQAVDYYLIEQLGMTDDHVGNHVRGIGDRGVRSSYNNARDELGNADPLEDVEPDGKGQIIADVAKGLTPVQALCYHLVEREGYDPETVGHLRDVSSSGIPDTVDNARDRLGVEPEQAAL